MLLRDHLGQLLPPARIKYSRRYDFLDGVVPVNPATSLPALEAPSGTLTVVGLAAGVPHAQVTSAAAVGAIAELRTAQTFDLTNVLAAGVSFQGMSFDSDVRAGSPPAPQFDVQFGWRSDTGSPVDLGAFCFQLNSQGTMSLTGRGDGTASVITKFGMFGGANARGTHLRDLSVLWLTRAEESHVLLGALGNGEQHIASLKSTAHRPGLCRPFLRIINKDANKHYLRAAAIDVHLWFNGAQPTVP